MPSPTSAHSSKPSAALQNGKSRRLIRIFNGALQSRRIIPLKLLGFYGRGALGEARDLVHQYGSKQRKQFIFSRTGQGRRLTRSIKNQ
jgi:hypothetical protein